jgi:hypothetical protein
MIYALTNLTTPVYFQFMRNFILFKTKMIIYLSSLIDDFQMYKTYYIFHLFFHYV